MSQRSKIFFSPDGLRSGWGLLLFFMLVSLVMFCRGIAFQLPQLTTTTHHAVPVRFLTPRVIIALCCVGIVTVILMAVLLGRCAHFGTRRVVTAFCLLSLWLSVVVTAIVDSAHHGPTREQRAAATRQALIDTTAGQPPLSAFEWETSQLAAILLVTWLLSLLERRPFGVYGLGAGPRRVGRFAHGAVVGLISISTLIGILWSGHWLALQRASPTSGGTLLVNGLLWGVIFVLVGIAEESIFRGYLQFTLARAFGDEGRGFWLAALLMSLLFVVPHVSNAGESAIGLSQVFLFGMFFCWSLWCMGNLWWAIGFHAAWDWGQSFLFGTADSGIIVSGRLLAAVPQGPRIYSGCSAGPEGSILCLPVLFATSLYIFLAMPKRSSLAPAKVSEKTPSGDPMTGPRPSGSRS